MLEACLVIKKFNVVFCGKKAYDKGKILRRSEKNDNPEIECWPLRL
ncbi:hypothetical protein ELI_2365 [Eubacterium callanderi]|uniref:Uncharacterized protein n=1 Tax=Eubacterium callanderi TaxID=53442 RepID=E3GDW5_9FIRM|nr:hypothetical protein ELI_2365 [Eubacterium callanderi]